MLQFPGVHLRMMVFEYSNTSCFRILGIHFLSIPTISVKKNEVQNLNHNLLIPLCTWQYNKSHHYLSVWAIDMLGMSHLLPSSYSRWISDRFRASERSGVDKAHIASKVLSWDSNLSPLFQRFSICHSTLLLSLVHLMLVARRWSFIRQVTC